MPTFNWQMTEWPKFSFSHAALRDELDAFAKTFRALSERARKVVLRMFEDGEAGAKAGLSAAKWMRMTKVSKATATRDLAELVDCGAIVAHGDGHQTHYRLNSPLREPEDPINDPINGNLAEQVLRTIVRFPGLNRERIALKVGRSVETVKRAAAALIADGKIEHRGSKKTGGYWAASRAGQPLG